MKFYFLIFYSLGLLVSSESVWANCKKGQRLVLATRVPGPPYIQSARDHMRRVFKKIGCEVEFVSYPYERALLMTSNGKVDGDALRIEGLESELLNLIRVTAPVARMTFYFYKKKGNNKVDFENISSLKELRICNNIGHRFRKLIADEYNLIEFRADDLATCQKMLISGHVDLFLGARDEFLNVEAKEFAAQVERASKPAKEADLYIYLNSKYEYLRPSIEKAFAASKPVNF